MGRNAELLPRLNACVPKGVSTKGLFISRAENAELWDVDDRRYLDFAAGIAVLNTGHRHPRVMQAVAKQLEQFTHSCFHVAPYETYLELAERLNRLAPGDFPKKTLFVTTGAEAVENAIKIARAATRRPAIIAFSGGFHGRTLLGLALTGKVGPYKKSFGPFPAGVFHAPFPNYSDGTTTEHALGELDRLFHADVDPADVAAMIVEPVQGEGGFHVAPPEFLRALRQIADQHGIVLIADEIQGGMARTGKLFSIEHSGVVPDLITTAKGLAGGFPLAGVTGKATLMDAAHVGGLGGTYAGSPVGIAAALTVMDVIVTENLCERATRIGERIRAYMEKLAHSLPCIGDLRGIGAMQALELVSDRATRTPDSALTSSVLQQAQKRGLLLLACGASANVIRLLPPLTISDEHLEEGLDILEAALRAAASAQP
jgi:4-aminobutyrate aminotransferase/4-aminobutyrate aminotransferase/(S)-3-amino-2-methylpropionate transaminase